MSIQAFKVADNSTAIVLHRNFEGEHVWTDSCWCRPVTVGMDSLRADSEIVEELERSDNDVKERDTQ